MYSQSPTAPTLDPSLSAYRAFEGSYNSQSTDLSILEFHLAPFQFSSTSQDDETNSNSATLRPVTVLVVDDDDNFRQAFVDSLLELSSIEVSADEAETGEDAIAKLKNHSKTFDVVFLDLILPKMNGLDTHSEIEDLHLKTRIVLMTSEPNCSVAERASQLGLSVYLKADLRSELVRILSGWTEDKQ